MRRLHSSFRPNLLCVQTRAYNFMLLICGRGTVDVGKGGGGGMASLMSVISNRSRASAAVVGLVAQM